MGCPSAPMARTCTVTAVPVRTVPGPLPGERVLPVWPDGTTKTPNCVAVAGAITLIVVVPVSEELLLSVTVSASCPAVLKVTWKVATPLVNVRLVGNVTVLVGAGHRGGARVIPDGLALLRPWPGLSP